MGPREAGSQGRRRVRARGSVPVARPGPTCGGCDSSGERSGRQRRRPGTASGTFKGAGSKRKPLRCLLGRAAPPNPSPYHQSPAPQPTDMLPPTRNLLTSGIAERDSGTCSGRRGVQTAAKARRGRWTGMCGSPPSSLFPQPSQQPSLTSPWLMKYSAK